MDKKICKTCNEEKDLNAFYKSKDHKDGKKPVCGECTKKYFFKYRHKNKKRVIDLDGEVWRDVVGYEGYYMVSNRQRIKGVYREIFVNGVSRGIRHEQILKQSLSPDGYPKVYLSINGKDRTNFIHVMVAKAFIPNPKNKKEVNHKFGNKLDARIESLEWVTPSENMKHAFRTGLISNKGDDHPRKSVTMAQVREIREKIKTGQFTHKQIAEVYGVSKSTIGAIGNRQNWNYD